VPSVKNSCICNRFAIDLQRNVSHEVKEPSVGAIQILGRDVGGLHAGIHD